MILSVVDHLIASNQLVMNLKKKHIISLLVAGAVVNTVPRYLNFESVSSLASNEKMYFIGQALSYVLILLAGYFRTKDKVVDIVFELTLWLAVSNLMDELFFDPIHLGINEIIFAILMIIYAIQQYKQYKRTTLDYNRNHKL